MELQRTPINNVHHLCSGQDYCHGDPALLPSVSLTPLPLQLDIFQLLQFQLETLCSGALQLMLLTLNHTISPIFGFERILQCAVYV